MHLKFFWGKKALIEFSFSKEAETEEIELEKQKVINWFTRLTLLLYNINSLSLLLPLSFLFFLLFIYSLVPHLLFRFIYCFSFESTPVIFRILLRLLLILSTENHEEHKPRADFNQNKLREQFCEICALLFNLAIQATCRESGEPKQSQLSQIGLQLIAASMICLTQLPNVRIYLSAITVLQLIIDAPGL